MRLKPEKIEQLAELVHDTLAKNPEVKLIGEKKDIVAEIARAITEDLQFEDKIEAEAREALEKHAEELRRSGMRSDEALRKVMIKLAREKKFVL